MNSATFIKDLLDYSHNITNYSLWGQQYKTNTVTSIEIKFESNEIKNFFDNCLDYLTTKVYPEMSIEEYPYADCKETIEYRNVSDKTISERIIMIKDSINNNAIPYNSESTIKFNCYAIKTYDDKNNETLFITVKNPLKNYTNSKIFFNHVLGPNKERFEKITHNNILQLVYHFDAIIFRNTFYFITPKMESKLNLPTIYQKNKKTIISELETIVSEKDIEKTLSFFNAKNSKTYKNISQKHIDNLKNKTKRNAIAKQLHIPLINGKFDLSQEESANKIIHYITNKIAIDIDDPQKNSISDMPLRSL